MYIYIWSMAGRHLSHILSLGTTGLQWLSNLRCQQIFIDLILVMHNKRHGDHDNDVTSHCADIWCSCQVANDMWGISSIGNEQETGCLVLCHVRKHRLFPHQLWTNGSISLRVRYQQKGFEVCGFKQVEYDRGWGWGVGVGVIFQAMW